MPVNPVRTVGTGPNPVYISWMHHTRTSRRASATFGRLVAGALCVGAATAGARAQGTITDVELTAMRDNTLYTVIDEVNSNGAGQHLFAGHLQRDPDGRRRAVLWFDLAGVIPPGATVLSAQLRLQATRTNGTNNPMTLHRLLADWGEGTSDAGEPGGQGAAATPSDATWHHRFFPAQPWANPGGDFDPAALSTLVLSGTGTYTWPSSPAFVAAVQSWANHSAANFGLILVGDEVLEGTSKRFSSREATNPAHRPVLLVAFAPACVLDYNQDTVLNPDDLGDFITDYFTSPPIPGPGGYAIACPDNDPPHDQGYRAAYVPDGSGQCNEPFPDNLGDYITAYFAGC